MAESTESPPAHNLQQAREVAAREARLAAALRANLRRRKYPPKPDEKTT